MVLLVMLFSTHVLIAQSLQIKGVVKDGRNGSPIVGVSVKVKEAKSGEVFTDVQGTYKLSAKKGDILVFSHQGYKTKEVKVSLVVHNMEMFPVSEETEKIVLEKYPRKKEFLKLQQSAPTIMAEACYDVSAASYNSINYDAGNNEDYGRIVENRFKSASVDPLSTFSIDVDAASYSNMRRMLNQGKMPEKDAIRTEELVNYFSYDYSQPTGKNPVNINTEVGECPWNKQHRLVKIGIKAREIPSENLPASNLVFLVDVSGSMYGPTRLELVKSSLKLLVNNLREKDRVAIVVYSGAAGEVLASTSGSDKQKIREALDNLTAGGSTAGGAGIQLAYKIAKKNFIEDGNNRVILCTDGDFNVGVSSNQGLEQLIEKERQSGVFLTVLGYGMGNYKDSKMQILAQKGNGNHAYIDNIQEANKVLVHEFGGTLYTVAKDVKLQIEFNPQKVQSYRLIGYESRLLNKEDFNDDTKDAGEMGAGHTVTAFYEVVPVGIKGAVPAVDELKYQKSTQSKFQKTGDSASNELLTVKLRYKLPNEDKSTKMEVALIDSQKDNVSGDFRFASSVAMLGQLLRNSDFKGTASYENVLSLAKEALGADELGYRREFVRLVEVAKGLDR